MICLPTRNFRKARLKRLLVIVLFIGIGLAIGWRLGFFEKFLSYTYTSINRLYYSKTVENSEEIELTGEEVLVIKNTFYIQKNNIILRGGAKLIIEDSHLMMLGPHQLSLTLEARDQSQVIIRNSKINTNYQTQWQISDASKLLIENSDISSSFWIVCGGYSVECYIRNISEFRGTISENTLLEISNTPKTFIEIAETEISYINETFPAKINVYEFPNQNDYNISFRLRIKNVESANWGINLPLEEGRVVIRNTSLKGLGIHFVPPYFENDTIELSNLRNMLYKNRTWKLKNIELWLINTSVESWYVYASGENYVIIRNSEISDNILSRDKAKFLYENVSIGLIRAQDEVEIILRNSVVHDDIIAEGNSKIILINTKRDWDNEIIEKDDGKVIIK